MSGRTSRTKGREWQAELARRWREKGIYPEAASSQGAQVRSSGGPGKTPPDVEGTPWWVEAKHTRASNPVGALRQAERERKAAGDERPAIAVVKPHGDRTVGPVVCMRLETFEQLMHLIEGSRAKVEDLACACMVPPRCVVDAAVDAFLALDDDDQVVRIEGALGLHGAPPAAACPRTVADGPHAREHCRTEAP